MKNIFKSRRQTAVKGRSQALLVSILVHIVIFLVAGTFVAVTVVQREEAKFEGKQISRPKMKLKKLQVPVKIEKKMKRQAPKLSQRVTATARVKTKSVDFKMPDVAGFSGGGVDVNLSGGFGGSLGFATTQINVFGLKSSGEKVVFILDTSPTMLVDEVGGIPAYKIIKDELTGMIGRLPPTALFNVIVFDSHNARSFSKELSAASDANVKKLKDWLAPLNSDKQRIGFSTLPPPSYNLRFEPMSPIYNWQSGWIAAVSYAVQKGADSIYWLGISDYLRSMHRETWKDCERGQPLKYADGWPPGTRSGGIDYESYGRDRWNKLVADARRKHKEENDRRLEQGKPVRVIAGGDFALVRAYFPSAPLPSRAKSGEPAYVYTGRDVVEYIEAMSAKYQAKDRRVASIGLKNKKISFNTIHFVPVNKEPISLRVLREVAQRMSGDYLQIKGLSAIQSAATTSDSK